MSRNLYKVPCIDWVKKSIYKMMQSNSTDIIRWCQVWSESYSELGGKSKTTSEKGCPRVAAYALWRLGRISGGGHPSRFETTSQVIDEFGKNAAYATIAISMFEQGWISRKNKDVWKEVRRRFNKDTGISAARTEQGAVRLSRILFEEGMIVQSDSA
jgi:hypothetical protein